METRAESLASGTVHGPLERELFPRDRDSGCFADMTRVFVVGTPSDELVEWHLVDHLERLYYPRR